MTINLDNVQTQLIGKTFPKLYTRKYRRLKVNKGKSVRLIFNQQQAYCSCQARIIDNFLDGCNLLLTTDQKVYKGQKLLILMNNIEPTKAQIIWSRQLNETQFRIGVKYLGF
ncbi:hypothetical protein [Crocosphaera chwakensis]|uniref:PilZ domain-containing protein n=1 Tax=Crocosphaera chwakensis CCY0110 TaxID=391612 RepID=A3IP29_9CHRO|nr:hypothetical protein [Crocosphaera chwakensis]EAZ91831.1 hypothetical protein CY0110_07719 [Crocosphaera chwakensis CCY0110]